ncbi:MAG TPA: cytochrome c4, partial [Paraburkholderia sp.]|nr:cytochrome c4 [Paraburkholderia sp.]
MSDERLFSLRNVWFRTGVGATIAVFVVAVLIGFVWLPSVKTDPYFQGVWNAICSAAGVPRQWHQVESSVAPGYQISQVELTPHMLDGATTLSVGRGATLALRC